MKLKWIVPVVLALAGCSGQDVCTLAACVDGVTFEIAMARPSDTAGLRLTVCRGAECVDAVGDGLGNFQFTGDSFAWFSFSDDELVGFLTSTGQEGRDLTVSLATKSGDPLFRTDAEGAVFTEVYPNGEDCPGLCRQAWVK